MRLPPLARRRGRFRRQRVGSSLYLPPGNLHKPTRMGNVRTLLRRRVQFNRPFRLPLVQQRLFRGQGAVGGAG